MSTKNGDKKKHEGAPTGNTQSNGAPLARTKRSTARPNLIGIWVGNGVWGPGTRLELLAAKGRTVTGWATPVDGPRVPLVVHFDGNSFLLSFPSNSLDTCEPNYSGVVTTEGVLRGECTNQANEVTAFEFRRVESIGRDHVTEATPTRTRTSMTPAARRLHTELVRRLHAANPPIDSSVIRVASEMPRTAGPWTSPAPERAP